MTTKTEEISSAVKTADEGITEAAAHAERLAESARAKATPPQPSTAGAGWPGTWNRPSNISRAWSRR